ncbi:TIGR00341 family protein [Pseudohalioglobus sediminis]|uniref:TIGR00341 family protein n=1 Tax=Pseudohalioglobus sediminis TaxID=2606449 RepID=A0A5B0X4G5_9GAMM|nr:TIGR00341 family protein [Pseudohalioglobus sediminis]KAA1194224.1 TIGR00341 family protein [Pseudohalioglobus sediminis]
MSEAAPWYLLHDSSFEADRAADWVEAFALRATPWVDREEIPADATVLLWLGDEQIRELADLALDRKWVIALLAHPEARQACTALGVKGDPRQLIEHYRQVDPIEGDALTCNGELVFSSVVVGSVLSLHPYDINRPQSDWSLLRSALSGLGKLTLNSYKLTTAKEQVINMGVLGLVGVAPTQSSLVGRRFDESLNIPDGRATLLVIAPRSVLAYLWFLLRLLLPGKISLSRLPESLALIRSERLLLESPEGFDYLLDGRPSRSSSELALTVLPERFRLLPGPALTPRERGHGSGGKETVRLNHVPLDGTASVLKNQHLPMFNHASEEEYRDLFIALRDNARPSSSFQVLMVLSVMLALAGLYADSAPVIIGAMILAPLMAPIMSFSMGLTRSEINLLRGAVKTLAVGIAWGLGCAVLLAWLMPFDLPTEEMRARMSPTLLDLFIAVISGVAGAYAHSREEIAKSLAGVAIAVALVPPLSVAGIGIGWGDWQMARGALLLLTTNLVGISLAASLSFLVLGFAPFSRARKGLAVSVGLAAMISIPLYVAFDHLVERARLEERVPEGAVQLLDQDVHVSHVRVTLGEPPLVAVVVSSPERLENAHVDELKRLIREQVQQDIQLEAQLNIRR